MALTKPDVYKTLYNFIETYCEPSLNGQIYKGNQNDMSLSKDDEYAIMWLSFNVRRGTNITEYEDLATTNKVSRVVRFQVDFYGENAESRAICFDNMFMSIDGNMFLNSDGLYAHYTDGIIDKTYIDANNKYCICYAVTGYIGYLSEMVHDAETANKLMIDKIEVIQ